MKHITVELEEQIRAQLFLCSERALADHNWRMANLDADGIPPKVEANEAEAFAWKRALEWVLREAGCL